MDKDKLYRIRTNTLKDIGVLQAKRDRIDEGISRYTKLLGKTSDRALNEHYANSIEDLETMKGKVMDTLKGKAQKLYLVDKQIKEA